MFRICSLEHCSPQHNLPVYDESIGNNICISSTSPVPKFAVSPRTTGNDDGRSSLSLFLLLPIDRSKDCIYRAAFGYLYKNNPYPSRKPLTVVILFLAPSCSSSSPLPRVFGCFSAWQEAQIRGLKLDQIFNRYRFL